MNRNQTATDRNEAALSIARRVVQQVAPHELPLVEDLFLDYLADPSMFDDRVVAPKREHSLGEGTEITLMASVVIPVVVGVLSHVITKGIDEIIEALRSRSKHRLSDEDVVKLAKAIADESRRDA